jgi:hypothetical protein
MTTSAELSAEDRVGIIDLIARYARSLDSGDLDAYVNNFAPDGVLFEKHAGHAQIREYVGTVIARRNADPHRKSHFVGIPTIDGSASEATVHSYLLWIETGAAAPIAAAAEYRDTVIKLNGRWVLNNRTLTRLAGIS